MQWIERALAELKTWFQNPSHRSLVIGIAFVLVLLILVRGIFRWKWLARLVGLDERLRKRNARKEAAKFERKGDLLEAARRYDALGEKEHAAQLAVKGGHHPFAAEVFRDMGRKLDAAYQYTKAEMWDQAAPLLESVGQIEQAADSYKRAHRPLLAGEMFARAGRKEEAARCFLEVGQLRKAADLFASANAKPRAAEVYERLSHELAGKKMATDRDLLELKEISKIGADLYKDLRDYKKAATLYERAGDLVQAGESLREAKDFKTSALLFRRAGRPDLAETALEASGDSRAAGIVRAERLAASGKKSEAADELEKHSEFSRAATMRAEAGDHEGAAAAYVKAGLHREAGTMLAQAGKHLEAAKAYEQAGAHAFAEQSFRKLNDPELLLAHYRRRGDPMAAGKMLLERGDNVGAIAEFQQVDAKHKQHLEAVGLLAHCFMRTGRNDLAIMRYEEAVLNSKVAFSNVRLFYEYGCLLEEERRPEEALDMFDRVISVHARYADAASRAEDLRHQLRGGTVSPPTEALETAHFSMEGQSAERYQVIREISRGTGGMVYLARDTSLNREVALKMLAQDLRSVPAARDRFLEEGRALAVLDHPNIVRIFDVVEEDAQVYLVTEYVKGETLRSYIETKGCAPVAEAIRIALDICAGLIFAHKRKIVHRDIKPANILLDETGAVKVLDFGLAKVMDLSEEATRQAEATICGTPRYMSPEQVLGRTVDVRADLYSLGATLFELISGRPPFTGGDLLYQHLYLPAPPLKSKAPAVPPELDAIINRLLLKSPDERFSSAEELAAALKAIVL